MATQVEQLAEDKVRLTVDVPAHDVHHAVEHAANDLAQSVRIPGFRQGKVPRPLLMQRIGKERLYAEAVESHIGGWFWNAATRARLNPVAQPEFEYDLPASESDDWKFSATVEVQPKPEPADWTTLEVPKHEAEVPQQAVDAELEMLQKIAAEIVPVEGRAAQDGDTVVVDLIAEDGSAQRDYVVELGSERLVEEIENGIRGLSAGEDREIAYELADGSRRTATVAVICAFRLAIFSSERLRSVVGAGHRLGRDRRQPGPGRPMASKPAQVHLEDRWVVGGQRRGGIGGGWTGCDGHRARSVADGLCRRDEGGRSHRGPDFPFCRQVHASAPEWSDSSHSRPE